MHIRMDRFKTLRWLMVLTGFIYMVERGADRLDTLVTHFFSEGTKFVKEMNKDNEHDREEAEAFQQALDRHNGTRQFKFKNYNEYKLVHSDPKVAKN